jgi:hypothetical protein
MKKIFLLLVCIIFAGCGAEPLETNIDIDLTSFSGTMVSATLLNIISNPDDYLGQRIRMSGKYFHIFWEHTDLNYHFVLVEGQDGCCPKIMEFRRDSDYIFPDDFPDDEALIQITGIFGTHEDFGEKSNFLSVDEMIVLE